MPINEAVIQTLEEAEYFYEQMEKTTRRSKDFRSNLSGFLSRARSITNFLPTLHSKDPKFKEWWAKKSREMQNDELMAFFIHARNVSEHRHPIGMGSSTHVRNMKVDPRKFGHDGFAINGKGDFVWVNENEDGKRKHTPMTEFNREMRRSWYFANPPPPPMFQQIQVVDLCGLYLIALKDLIREATSIVENQI